MKFSIKLLILALTCFLTSSIMAQETTATGPKRIVRNRLSIPGCTGRCSFCHHNGVQDICHGPCVNGLYVGTAFGYFSTDGNGGYCIDDEKPIDNCDSAVHLLTDNYIVCVKCSDGYAPVDSSSSTRCLKLDSTTGVLDPNASSRYGVWKRVSIVESGKTVYKYLFDFQYCKYGYKLLQGQVVEGLGEAAAWPKCVKNELIPTEFPEVANCNSYSSNGNQADTNYDFNGVICSECKSGYSLFSGEKYVVLVKNDIFYKKANHLSSTKKWKLCL